MVHRFSVKAFILFLVFAVFLTTDAQAIGSLPPTSVAHVVGDPQPTGRPIPDKTYPGWDGESGLGEAIDPRYRKLVVDIAQMSEEPEVRAAAQAALDAGTTDAIEVFLDTGEVEAQQRAQARRDETARLNREAVLDLRGTGGPIFNAEVERVLAGSDYDRSAFLDYGRGIANERDQRAQQSAQDRAAELRTRVTALVGSAGPEVKRAAQVALAAGDAAIAAFLNGGYLEAAKVDAAAHEQYLKELEARNKAAEQASDLAKRAARASLARKNLLIAHGHGIRALQRSSNAMISASTAARQAAQILAANNAGGHHSPESFSIVRQEVTRQLGFANQAASDAQSASVAASAEASILVDTGLPYGADWAQMARGMAAAAQAAVGAITTAQHALEATMATDAAVGDQDQAVAKAEEAKQWRLHAQEHATAAASLATAAQVQAKAAEDAAVRASQALAAASKANDDASAALRRTQAATQTARDEQYAASRAREVAEQQRDTAARYRQQADDAAADARKARAEAETQKRIAADYLRRAQAQDGIAAAAEATALRDERDAKTARDRAWEAKRYADGAEARAQALEASAKAAHATDQEAPAWAAANAARQDAIGAAGAAAAASSAASRATGAAARAREAATQATYAAAASRAAAADAANHAANANVAASSAESSAADVHTSAMQANAEAAKATAEEVKAAANARAAAQLAEQAQEQARLSTVDAVRAKDAATESSGEAVSAATQATLSTRASLAARASAAATTDRANTTIVVVAPFTGADLDADFVAEVAAQAQAVGDEQAQAAQARATEAQNAATVAQQSADQAGVDTKVAFQAAADAAKSAYNAAKSAADAQKAAAGAANSAYFARLRADSANASDRQAHESAVQARQAANLANQDAAIAGLAADQAEGQATAARAAAATAERDALAARNAAADAQRYAADAAAAADSARTHAQNTSAAAARAREFAADAQRAADEAEKEQRKQEDQRRRIEAMVLAGCLPGLTTEDVDDMMGDDQSKAALDEYVTAQADCMNGNDVISFLIEIGAEVLIDYIGIPDFKRCFGEGDIGACLWSVVDIVGLVLPFLKGTKIVSAIDAVVLNIGKFIAKSETIKRLASKVALLLDAIRKVCRIVPKFQASSPTGTPFQTGPPAKKLAAEPRATAMAGRFQCEALVNIYPEHLAEELAAAARVGAHPIAVGSADFITKMRSSPGVMLWAVLMDDSLVVIPSVVDGVDIKHAVLSGGANVKSAGEATFAIVDGKIVPKDINLHSGHFKPPMSGSRGRAYLNIGKDAFAILGYVFP